MNHLRRVLSAVLAALALLCLTGASDDPFDSLHAEFKGKYLTIRGFYPATILKYDSSGVLKNKTESGSWTADGVVKIKRIAREQNKLHIEGERHWIVFKGKYGEEQRFVSTDQAVVLECDLASGSEPRRLLNAIFISPDELPSALPPLWTKYIQADADVQLLRSGFRNLAIAPKQPLRIRESLARQLLATTALPRYPSYARRANLAGSAIFFTRVNTSGNVVEVKVLKPIGAGMDEFSAASIARWKYHPLRVRGNPIEFVTYVRVNYRLD